MNETTETQELEINLEDHRTDFDAVMANVGQVEDPKFAEYRERSQKLDEMALDNALGLQVLLSREIQKYFDNNGGPSQKKLSDESSAILSNLATAAKNALCEH